MEILGTVRPNRDRIECGCSHHTVTRYVAAGYAGGRVDKAGASPQLIDEFLPKVEEWARFPASSRCGTHRPVGVHRPGRDVAPPRG